MTVKFGIAFAVVEQPTHVLGANMPNKFSHSVVLSHYSSLGLIDLPNSQHGAFPNSYLPPSSSTSSTASKAQSNPNRRSLARDGNENIRQTSLPGQPADASTLPDHGDSRQTTGKRTIIDTDVRSENAPDTSRAKGYEKESSTSAGRTSRRPIQRNQKQFGIQSMNVSGLDGRQRRTSRVIFAEPCSSSEAFATSQPTTASEHSLNASQTARTGVVIDDNTSNRVGVLWK